MMLAPAEPHSACASTRGGGGPHFPSSPPSRLTLAPPREGQPQRSAALRAKTLRCAQDKKPSMHPGPQRSAASRTTTLAVRRPLLRAKGGTIKEWQNLLIMHDLRVPDGKRGPSRQDIREMYSPTAFSPVLSIHRKQILPKLADFACISVISCHEGAFSPSGALLGIHRDEILP